MGGAGAWNGYGPGPGSVPGPDQGYDLGIDLGTTFTAAAVCPVGRPGVHVVPLERGSAQVPSVLLVDQGGALLVGSEAEARAARSPERVVREFKRRLGDETPIVVAGTPFSADGVAAEMVRWTADRVAEQRGAAPRRLAVSHPAGWGSYRRRVFADALAEVGLHDVVLLAEPEAAAVAHAAAGRVPPGRTVAVYDLGGGTFDAAVVRGLPPRAGGAGVAVLGRGQGLEALGGIDFDEALFWHVCGELGGAVAALDPADPEAVRAVAGLRRACVAAKETLSVDTEAVVEVELPTVRTWVRVTRGEFEEMIEPALRQTVDVLGEVLDTAGVPAAHLDAVLLVGGSARIPLVARLLAEELGRPVVVDPDPTTAVARGTAVAAAVGRGADQCGLPPSGPFPAAPRMVPMRPVAPVVVGAAPVVAAPGMHPFSGPLPAVGAAQRTGALLAPDPATERVGRRGLDAARTAAAHPGAAHPGSTHPGSTHPGSGHPGSTHPGSGPSAGLAPMVPVARGPRIEAEPVTAPMRLDDLRAVPSRPPVRVETGAEALAPPAKPDRRRRRVALAVGSGVALAVGAVVAVTVPIIQDDPAPKAQTSTLPSARAAADALGAPGAALPATAPPGAVPSGVPATDAASGVSTVDPTTAATAPAGSPVAPGAVRPSPVPRPVVPAPPRAAVSPAAVPPPAAGGPAPAPAPAPAAGDSTGPSTPPADDTPATNTAPDTVVPAPTTDPAPVPAPAPAPAPTDTTRSA